MPIISIEYFRLQFLNTNYIYDVRLFKEIKAINYISRRNLPIIYSRNYTTATTYKKCKENVEINKKIKYYNNVDIVHRDILIAIYSHISLFYQRHVYRRIYKDYENIKFIFFVALDKNESLNSQVYREMKKCKDIVLFAFICNYNNLHFFTYSFLTWLNIYKNYFKIIIKQDTDTFLNINLLKNILYMIPMNKSFVLGYIWMNNIYNRRYPSGMSYLFLSKSIKQLLLYLDKEFNKVKFGYPEDKLFGNLCRDANFTFIDVRKAFNYKIYLRIPNKVININETYMIHWLRISEIAYLHLLSNNRLYKYIKKY